MIQVIRGYLFSIHAITLVNKEHSTFVYSYCNTNTKTPPTYSVLLYQQYLDVSHIKIVICFGGATKLFAPFRTSVKYLLGVRIELTYQNIIVKLIKKKYK